ncbi:hypothetical protein HBI56_146700 [Parastagonospora nodorum]|nr:hypothetical protein HBI10_167560 [Parastagonospora nodorum]KAH4015690.1 hypothetical protein HBI13_157150 [Parastagonospora nodorum]KAH4023886.1 hypothetical protein HBI09_165430 [Parastagonospora nodorum]KAH4045705.1 hypothetical protein HBH49_194240 [Parastagonospora nodorum]KAH4107064.1 hypothetical protein HBH46_063050 [Parastagonospora nodorum]
MDILETPSPSTPHTDCGPSLHDFATKTPRLKRRREWQEGKIAGSRAKNKNKSVAAPAAQGGSMVSASTTETETHDAFQSQVLQGSCSAGGKAHPLPDRSPGQWKTIRQLKLCAGCLTRTIPPHNQGSEDAPCKGQPDALFDKVKISRIRRELQGRYMDSERARRKYGQQSKQPQPGDVSSPFYQHGNPFLSLRHSLHPAVSHFDHVLPVLGNASGVPATPGYLLALTAPPFNVHDPSSVFHPRERLSGSKQCAMQRVSRSSGSVTQIGDSDRLLVPNEPCIARTPYYSHASAAINVKQSSEQNIDIMGMDPPTPVIPKILIEADIGPTSESLQETAVMPCSESSKSAFTVAANDHDWDDETRVPETIHGSQDKNHVEEDLSTSALLVEKLMGETAGIMSSVPRSWTL